MNEWLYVELNVVPGTLHVIGSSIKQTEVSNDQARKTDNATKKIVIVVVVVVCIIVIIHLFLLLLILLLIIIIVIVVNYGMSSSTSFLEPFRYKLYAFSVAIPNCSTEIYVQVHVEGSSCLHCQCK
jgi:type IV secretory pathway TrbL component